MLKQLENIIQNIIFLKICVLLLQEKLKWKNFFMYLMKLLNLIFLIILRRILRIGKGINMKNDVLKILCIDHGLIRRKHQL